MDFEEMKKNINTQFTNIPYHKNEFLAAGRSPRQL